jgi:hypothetical protein
MSGSDDGSSVGVVKVEEVEEVEEVVEVVEVVEGVEVVDQVLVVEVGQTGDEVGPESGTAKTNEHTFIAGCQLVRLTELQPDLLAGEPWTRVIFDEERSK